MVRKRRIQADEYYQPSPKESDFNDVELAVIKSWTGVRPASYYKKKFKLSAPQYAKMKASILERLHQKSISQALAGAVVLGFFK